MTNAQEPVSVEKVDGRWSVDHDSLGTPDDALLLCERMGIEVTDCNDHEELENIATYLNQLEAALGQCITAFHFTREYVGEDVLPEVEGWAWFDAVEYAKAVLNS